MENTFNAMKMIACYSCVINSCVLQEFRKNEVLDYEVLVDRLSTVVKSLLDSKALVDEFL